MGDAFDPVTFLRGWTAGHPNNVSGWSNKKFDAHLRKADETLEAQRRLDILAKAEFILLREAPVIPLYSAGNAFMAGPRLSGLTPNPMSRFPLKHLRLQVIK